MASEPAYATPEWYNGIARRATSRIIELATPAIKRSLLGGYAGGFSPISLTTLQKMPSSDAIGFLANMMNLDITRADGVRLFAQYLNWLEQTGQIDQAMAKSTMASVEQHVPLTAHPEGVVNV